MKLTVYTTATSGYERALETQARRVCASLSVEKRVQQKDIQIILLTNHPSVVEAAYRTYVDCLPQAQVKILADDRLGGSFENYKTDSQLLIAQMRTKATMQALAFDSDRCLSLDGDVLPPHNAIRCMLDMLEFDNGYYGVSFCPYPSHGGGAFLGGRGTIQNPILPDSYEDEKVVPKELKAKRAALVKRLSTKGVDALEAEGIQKDLHEIEKTIRSIPPNGNVFALNAKGWRKRGWFDMAYPAIGKGAVVPVDWTGCGCTMMNREALSLCDWSGYEGKGTEDLYINFHRWAANGIRSCCIPHCPCDHVVRNPDPEKKLGEFVHVRTGHETEGECVGHLRQWRVRWYTHEPGEQSKEKPSPEDAATDNGQATDSTL
jgi:hypothetical protein